VSLAKPPVEIFRSGKKWAHQASNMAYIKLGVRNVVRHRSRTTFALSAIGFGVVALLLANGFIEWIYWATRESTIRNGLGHIQVMRPGYRDSGAADPLSYLLPESSPQLFALDATPEAKAVTPRLNFGGLISHGDMTLSFLGEGVNPERESLVSSSTRVSHGEALSSLDPKGILLGLGLAAKLGVKVGERVVLVATSASGGINAVEGHVRGLFATEVKSYDDLAVRLPIDLARTLLKVSGSTAWVIGLRETELTKPVVERLGAQHRSAKLEFVPWYELSDFYAKTVALLSSQMNFVRLLIGLIIVLSISNMLIMNVLERTGEIGTMMAMGSRRRDILMLFFGEGLLLGALGGAAGVVVGLVLAQLISAVGIPMPPPPGRSAGYSAEILVTWGMAAGAFALAFGTTLLAGVYPAWKASRMEIVDALRHNR